MSELGRVPEVAAEKKPRVDCRSRFRWRKRLYFGWWLMPIPMAMAAVALEDRGLLFPGAGDWGIVSAILTGLFGPLVLWRCPACGGLLPNLGMWPVLFSGARFVHDCGALLQE